MSVSNKISQEGTHVECHLLVVLLAQVAYNNERLGILSLFFFFARSVATCFHFNCATCSLQLTVCSPHT